MSDMPAPTPPADPATEHARRMRARLWTAGLLTPILVIGAYFRFVGLGTTQLYGDDAEYAIVARYLSRDWSYLAYPALEGFGAVPFVSQPPLILYLMALAMKVFGATDFAATFPSAVLGLGTVAVVFFLGMRLGGRFVATASALFLSILPFHVEMSRKAQLDAGLVFFFTLTTYFLVAWIQSRRAADEALARRASAVERDRAPAEEEVRRALRRSRIHAASAGAAMAGAALSKLPGALAGPVVAIVFLLVLAVAMGRSLRRKAKGEVPQVLLEGGLGALPIAIGAGLYLGLLVKLTAVQNLWIKLQWQLGRVDSSRAAAGELAAFDRPWNWYFTDSHYGFVGMFRHSEWILYLALPGLAIALFQLLREPRKRLEHGVMPVFILLLLGFFLWSDRKEGFYLLPFAPFVVVLSAQTAATGRDLLRAAGLWSARFAPALRRHIAPLAFAAALLLVAVPAYPATEESIEDYALDGSQQKYFGYGTREAALLISERDPTAGQYGTLLGRFTLHWYNEQPVYHWYVDHTYIEDQIQNGQMRFIVYDNYLDLAHDRDFMQRLINKYNGVPIQTYREGWGDLTVYELHP